MARHRRAIAPLILFRSARDHGRVPRLAEHDLRLRTFLPQHATHAFERSSGTEPRHPEVESPSREIVDDLAGRRTRVHVGVRLILELPREEPPILLRELDGLL